MQFSAGHSADSLDNLQPIGVLHQISAGTGLGGPVNILLIVETGEDEHIGGGLALLNGGQNVESGHLRHTKIQQHDIDGMPVEKFQRFFAAIDSTGKPESALCF